MDLLCCVCLRSETRRQAATIVNGNAVCWDHMQRSGLGKIPRGRSVPKRMSDPDALARVKKAIKGEN